MPKLTAMARLALESSAREGIVPPALDSALAVTPLYSIASDAFLLSLPNGLIFHYRKGAGVTYARPASVSDTEVTLFLNGSVYGAVAWLNGLIPLHASAVVQDGTVHAFTGKSGAGKSTLSAGLTRRGLPLFADDVLVLDLSDPQKVMALPGHKMLKLWGDALGLTGLSCGEAVRADMDKYFVSPPLLDQAGPLPLRSLYFLDVPTGTDPVLTPLSGAECFTRMRGAFYRPRYGGAVIHAGDVFAATTRLGTQIALQRFDRPAERDRFGANVDFLAAAVRSAHG